MKGVRVRFAPAPTGSLHVGGARTALFNWLFARRHGGAFVLRLEDTDARRSTEESARGIVSAFKWLGIDWDEGPDVGGPYGPYRQSQRAEIYREHVGRLLDEGSAYRCFCTPDELEARRREAKRRGRPPRYDGRCRGLSRQRSDRLAADGRPFAVRLMTPDAGSTQVDDAIRGRVTFENEVIDDFVVMKSDGSPTYNFACVVDDALMRVSHVIRGEEHLSNTPKQIIAYRALGYEPPVFAHVPMILSPDRSKLSKRHGATSVQEFKEKGYLPEALVNYLALLGWSPEDEREILSRDELVSRFSLDRVASTAAIYDVQKLTWLNGHYVRASTPERILELALPFLQREGLLPEPVPPERLEWVTEVVAAVQERIKTLGEIPSATSPFFADEIEYDPKAVKKLFTRPGTTRLLEEAARALDELEPFTLGSTEETYRALAERQGISTSALFHPTRLALTGRTVGPGLFDVMVLLGRERCVERLRRAARYVREGQLEADR